VQSIGPSPVVIHRKDLEAIAKTWEETSVSLKTEPEADSRLGWVIEMWGYAIAAAKIGLRHQEFADFQVEPGALSTSSQLRGFPLRYWIVRALPRTHTLSVLLLLLTPSVRAPLRQFHYTYQFEYMLDGSPCQPWTIGEYSLDKRHFSDQYPTYPLPEPPPKANPAAFYLLHTFNDAMGNISAWPARQPTDGKRPTQTLYGRRRLDWFSRHANGFATELRTMPLVKKLAGSRWTCKGERGERQLALSAEGNAEGLAQHSSRGRWGTMNDPTLEPACPVYSCIFIDVGGGYGGNAYEARFDQAEPPTLTIMRHPGLEEEWKCQMR